MSPGAIFLIAWGAWALSWIAASLWSRPTQRTITVRETWSYRVPIIVGAILLNYRTSIRLGAPRLWHVGYDGAYVLAGITILGFVIAWWARLYLGSLWSGNVTLKEDHTLVDTGPYRWVRHPIYTGLILSTVASAAVVSTVPALLGGALIVFGIWLKASIEERFLSASLGEAVYRDYCRRVPMLVPFVPTGG